MPEIPPVRGIITTPIFGGAPSGTGQISNGVTVGGTGATERWCYNPSPPSPHGGIYDVTTGGVWTRSSDLDFATDNSDFSAMPWFQVREGSNMIAGSTWWYSGDPAPVEGTTVITFVKRDNGKEWEPGTDLEAYDNTIRLIQRGDVAGNWAQPVVRLTGGGVVAGIVSGAETDTTSMEGLAVERMGGTSLRFYEGTAFAPDAGVLDLDANLTKSGLSLSPSNWNYAYLFLNEGEVDAEVIAQRPASPYRGNARVKGGGTGGVLDNTNPDTEPDASRRFLRSVRADGSGNVRPFADFGDGWVEWQEDTGAAPYRVLSNGLVGNTWTVVDCSNVVPPTARRIFVVVRVPGGQPIELNNSGSGAAIFGVGAGQVVGVRFVLSADRKLYYRHPGGVPGTGSNIDVLAFFEPVA